MGEHADDMLNGLTCANCGEWIGEDCGYPRLCVGCAGANVDADDAADRGAFTVTIETANGHDRSAEQRAIVRVHTPKALTPDERAQIDAFVGDTPRFHGCPYCERSRFQTMRALGQHAYHAHQRKVTKDGGPTS